MGSSVSQFGSSKKGKRYKETETQKSLDSSTTVAADETSPAQRLRPAYLDEAGDSRGEAQSASDSELCGKPSSCGPHPCDNALSSPDSLRAGGIPEADPKQPTTSNSETDLLAKQQAYKQRKDAKLARRAKNAQQYGQQEGMLGRGLPSPISVSSRCFLSNVPEVSLDIQYRFNLVLLGEPETCEQVAKQACESRAACSLPKLEDEVPQSERDGLNNYISEEHGATWKSTNSSGSFACKSPASSEPSSPSRASSPSHAKHRTSRSAPQLHRCLCRLTMPLKAFWADQGSMVREPPRLVRLGFHPVDIGARVPKAETRQDALMCAVVFIVLVDPPPEGQSAGFREQLQNVATAVERIRLATSARLRPVRALVLCYICAESRSSASSVDVELPGSVSKTVQENWAGVLADFEQTQGSLWKFGPVSLSDSDALHAIFTEIASTRILGSQTAGEPTSPTEEGEGADPEDASPGWLPEDLALERRASSSSSEVSEGWQQPPLWEAEDEGSECTEGALEMHERFYKALSPRSMEKPAAELA